MGCVHRGRRGEEKTGGDGDRNGARAQCASCPNQIAAFSKRGGRLLNSDFTESAIGGLPYCSQIQGIVILLLVSSN